MALEIIDNLSVNNKRAWWFAIVGILIMDINI